MTGVEATKVKVYNSCYHDNALEVFLKAVKDGRAIVTRGWTKVVRAYGMQEGTLWAFRFFNTINSQNDLHLRSFVKGVTISHALPWLTVCFH